MNSWVNRWFVFYPGRFLRGENIFRYQKFYQETQWWSPERLQDFQWQQLKKLLNHAYHTVPFYQKKFREAGIHPEDIRTFQDFTALPIITRDDFIRYGKEFISTRFQGRHTKKVTGGTTAQPVVIPKNRRATALEDAAMFRAWSWWNILPGDRQARFWGTSVSKRVNWRNRMVDWVMNRRRMSAMNFTEERLWKFFLEMRKFKPQYFYGYTSLIIHFTQAVLNRGGDLSELNLKGIITTAEPIFPEQVKLLESAYRAPHINDYGSSELGPILYKCPQGSMHLMAENLYTEIVDERGRPVPDGVTGCLILTDLHNYAMPLIRYNIRDLTARQPNRCSCGRGLPVFELVSGRKINLLQATDGSYVHAMAFYYIIEDLVAQGRAAIQLQAIQESSKKIRLNIVKNYSILDEDIRELIMRLKMRFGEDMHFEIHWVDELEREKSGKLFITKNLILK